MITSTTTWPIIIKICCYVFQVDFIKAVSVFKLDYSIRKERESFLKGFWEV